jgi:hypothetical protein
MAGDEFWMIRVDILSGLLIQRCRRLGTGLYGCFPVWISRSSKNHGHLAMVVLAMLLTGSHSSPKTEEK